MGARIGGARGSDTRSTFERALFHLEPSTGVKPDAWAVRPGGDGVLQAICGPEVVDNGRSSPKRRKAEHSTEASTNTTQMELTRGLQVLLRRLSRGIFHFERHARRVL